MRYFIYCHKVHPNSPPFYIGRGTINDKARTHKSKYRRAYKQQGRNTHWHNTVKKYGFCIEILEEFVSLEECQKRETELIDFYGRKVKEEGILVNIIRSDEELVYITTPKLYIAAEKRKKEIHKYSLEGNYICSYSSMSEAAIETQILIADISDATKQIRKIKTGGFLWSLEKQEKIKSYEELKKERKSNKIVYQISLDGILIKEWASSKEASNELNILYSSIRNCLIGLSKTAGGYHWKYNL